MSLRTAVWLIAVSGGVFSFATWRIERAGRSSLFRLSGLALLAGLLLLLRYRTRPIVHSDLLILGTALACWLPFVAHWVVQAVPSRSGEAHSKVDIKTSPSYAAAEAALRRKDVQEALLLFHQAAAEFPKDPDIRRRMAELFLLVGLPDDAIISFRDAEKFHKQPEDKLLLVFAIAETLQEHKKDVPGAIKVIEDFLKRHPNVAGREYADGRLERLRAIGAESRAEMSRVTV